MFSDEIERLRHDNLFRHIKDRGPICPPARILINNIEYINFSSNDYLGLSNHPSIIEAANKAIEKYGLGAGASRLLSGGTELHATLEKKIAEFKGSDAALIFNSGYTANISAIPVLASEGDIIFSDELNHASIIDGCRLSKAKKVIYRHRDVEHLSELIKKEHGKRKMVITDTVFSMDGDIAPLKEISDICTQHDAILYIDDAHGTGVLGSGRGALTHFGIKPTPQIIQMGTFSKALGSYGAFIAADKNVIQWLINTARGFIYSTALPACVIAASLEALNIVQNDLSLIKNLWQNREMLFKGLMDLGFYTINSETPIIPIVVGDTNTTLKFSELLMHHNIYAPAIRPPTVKVPRIRVSVTAAHTEEDINKLLKGLRFAK
ncbi:putative 8-amino-7-oxononanoate synthase [Dissulfurispira thermophila]|uniref:8-amino-7-ketopelargonate synthase n=2 Tax=root TaxID=1 RepID=A0A7G1H1J5_9BACT|nr:8-amino-7-oxononanoate synthase [Dissulfurispira thermophila]BCB95846.1 putative 8-amino-7-oxononanoate synthase [Dissulfurispira thermophila]